MKTTLTTIDIARICHEANVALCSVQNDESQKAWFDSPQWQRESAIAGVNFHRDHPDASPAGSHESWLAQKAADGWVYGTTKDADAKTHPCIVPFEALPPLQQAKDHLFRSICRALLPFAA